MTDNQESAALPCSPSDNPAPSASPSCLVRQLPTAQELRKCFTFRCGWAPGADRGPIRAAHKAEFATKGQVGQKHFDALSNEERAECEGLGLERCLETGFSAKDRINADFSDAGIYILRWNSRLNRHQVKLGGGTQQTAHYFARGQYEINDALLIAYYTPGYGRWYRRVNCKGGREALLLFVVDNDVDRFAGDVELQQATGRFIVDQLWTSNELTHRRESISVMVGGPTEETMPGIESASEEFFNKVFAQICAE